MRTVVMVIVAASLAACSGSSQAGRVTVSAVQAYQSERWGSCAAIELASRGRAYSAHACTRAIADAGAP